jgi:hypothetical protein
MSQLTENQINTQAWHRALKKLLPENVGYSVSAGAGYESLIINDDTVEKPSEEEVLAEVDIQKELLLDEQYKNQRVEEYPSIGDQLDALFHAGVYPEEMATKIQAVKEKYPKP